MGTRNRLAQILAHWPDEVTNKGNDLGSFLRRLQRQQPRSLDSPKRSFLQQVVESLEKISTNYYRKKYWRERETCYTDIKQLITRDPWIPPHDTWKSCWQSDMLEYEAEQNKKWRNRLWKRLTFWKKNKT